MARIQCENCDRCAIRGECDAINEMIEENSCITDHSILLGIYERCKVEALEKAQEECERCVYSGWKEQMKKHDAKVRADTIKELRIVKQGRTITSTLRTLQLNEQKECYNCENLMFSDCYGECVFGGIVNAHDTCNKWRKKE